MQYAYTSMKNVIGSVIRNTNLQDASQIYNIHEWLLEAIHLMETEESLIGKCEEVPITFHKSKLPCGLRWIDGVEYNGRRLGEGRSLGRNNYRLAPSGSQPSLFQTSVQKIEPIDGHFLYDTKLHQLNQLPFEGNEYYYTDMGTINTSFADGIVTIYFHAVESDQDGLPVIPDNQNFIQALYWYCRAMMIGSGWEDKQFDHEYCLDKFENLYAPRAIAELRVPSPEQMERRVNTFARFIPPGGYYEQFFNTDRREAFFDTKIW